MRAGIALGSNLGDRLATLRAARAQLSELPKLEKPLLVSAVYETDPIGCEPNAPPFLNAVIEIGYSGDARALLGELRQIEAALGRPVMHERNASRTLDLDLLYFGETQPSESDLQLPHPRMRERRFVLEPLYDIRPELVLPAQREDVATLLNHLPATPPLVRVVTEW